MDGKVRSKGIETKCCDQSREVFKFLDYSYFKSYFGLPDLPRKIDEQIKCVREFLSIFIFNSIGRKRFNSKLQKLFGKPQ